METKSKFCSLKVDPFLEGVVAQIFGSRHEVTKVVSLCKNGRKTWGVPIYLKRQARIFWKSSELQMSQIILVKILKMFLYFTVESHDRSQCEVIRIRSCSMFAFEKKSMKVTFSPQDF